MITSMVIYPLNMVIYPLKTVIFPLKTVIYPLKTVIFQLTSKFSKWISPRLEFPRSSMGLLPFLLEATMSFLYAPNVEDWKARFRIESKFILGSSKKGI